MELILEKIAERQAEMALLPQSVKIWVMFMRVWFLAGLLFVYWYVAPRWIVLTMIATAFLILATKILIPDFDTIRAGTIIQLLLWTPLALYLTMQFKYIALAEIKSPNLLRKIYGVWISVSTILVIVSTGLNIYNVASWLT